MPSLRKRPIQLPYRTLHASTISFAQRLPSAFDAGIGRRDGAKFPVSGNFSRPTSEFVGFLYFGQRLGRLFGRFPGAGTGNPADPNRERRTPSRELKMPNKELK